MKLAVKPSHLNPLTAPSGSRVLGAPIVQPEIAKVSLGSAANTYLSNLNESVTATAIISSLGQLPTSFLGSEKAQVLQALSTQPLNSTANYSLQTDVKQALLSEILVQEINSLSLGGSSVHSISTLPNQLINIDNLQMGEVQHSVPLNAQHQTISIELFSLAVNTPPSYLVNLPTANGVVSSTNLTQVAANDTFNLAGLGSLINQTAISSVTNLGTSAQVRSEFQQPSSQVFDGITVSGQSDGIEFFIITSKAQTPVAHSNSSIRVNDADAPVAAQHSIILISVSLTSQASSEFGI